MQYSKRKFNELVGKELIKIRKELSLSQEEFAEKTNTGRTYIGEIERGEKSPSVYKLYKILSYLNISLEEFFSKI